MRLIQVIFGCSLALAQPQPGTVSGVFQVVVVEDLGKAASPSEESRQYSLLTGKEALRLIFEDPQDAEKILPGSRIEVTGYRTSRQFTVLADSAAKARRGPRIRMMSAAPAPKTLGQRKLAVLLVNFQNDQRQLITSATASASAFGDVNSFYQEASYGNLSIVGDVYGYLTLPVTSACNQLGLTDTTGGAGFSDIQNAATAAAQNAGINLSGYDTVMLIGPYPESCSEPGEAAATLGGIPGFVECMAQPSALSDHTLAHEIGHNLGLYHAHLLNCGKAVYANNALTACAFVEYGDLDVMGQSLNSTGDFRSPSNRRRYAAQFSFIGMTPGSVGLAQADIQIPPTLAPGTYPVRIWMGNLPTGLSNTPLITTN